MRWFWLAPGLDRRFLGRVSVVEQLIGELNDICAGLPDKRTGPRRDGDYTMADIGLSAFSIFFMASPSFLAHQRAPEEGHGRSNCETLFEWTRRLAVLVLSIRSWPSALLAAPPRNGGAEDPDVTERSTRPVDRPPVG
jgi:hypothetical protein